MSVVSRIPHLAAAVAVILLVGLPTVSVPQAIAPSHPEVALDGGVRGVVASDLGGPLGGAVVVAEREGEQVSAFTDADGRYQLDLGAGSWALQASARGHGTRNATAVVVAGGVGSERNFTLPHTGPALRGTVRDAKTGAAVAGATVEAHQDAACRPDQPCPMMEVAPAYYKMPLQTRSGADGKYALGLDGEGPVNLRVAKDGYRDHWVSIDVQGDTTQDLRLEAVPPKNAVLEGRVVDAKTGAPVAKAWVSAWPGSPPRAAGADEPAAGGGASGSAGTTIAPSPPVDCPPEADCIDPRCCYVEGNSTQTDSDGRFRMGMHPGDFQVSVGAPEYGQHTGWVRLGDGERATYDVRLEPIPEDSVTVRGTVVDKATGKPVPGAWVSVENQQWGHYAGANTGEDGRFEARTKPGWTMVWVRVEGGGYATPASRGMAEPAGDAPQADGAASEGNATPAASSIARPMPAPSGASYYPWVRSQSFAEGQTVDLRVELQPKPKADVRIEGYVLNATSKKPIPGAYVNVHNEDTGDWGWAQADKDGSFVLRGRPGMHTINAGAEGHFANAVVVQVSAPATRVDIALQPGHSQGGCCVAYAQDAEARGVAMDASASGAPSQPGAPAMQGEASGSGDASRLSQGPGQATYAAAGGLGPYDPAKAPAPNTGAPGSAGRQVPGAALGLALAAVGVAALVLGRRR